MSKRTWVTVKEAAKLLNVCTATIYRMVRRGDLAAERVKNSLRIDRTSLDDYHQQQESEQANKDLPDVPPSADVSQEHIKTLIMESVTPVLEQIHTLLAGHEVREMIREEIQTVLSQELPEMIQGAIRDELRALEPPTIATIPTTADIEIEPEPPVVTKDHWARRLLIAFQGAVATLKRGLDAMLEQPAPPEPLGDKNEE